MLSERIMGRSKLKLNVDVIMPVFNSELFLQRCLESIYRELPVNRLIVIDSWSTDNTLKIVRGFPKTEIYQCANNLSMKRQLGINLVETELYCFIDSDVELLDGFSSLANLFKDPKLGAVYAHPLNPYHLDFQFFSNLATNKLAEKLGIGSAEFRPFGPCFIRKKATFRIKIPPMFDMNYEDYYIAQYIRHKGFKIINVYDRVFALHHQPRSTARKPKHSLLHYERLCGRPIVKRTFWKLAISIPKGLYAFHLCHHPGIIFWEFKGNLNRLSDLLGIFRSRVLDSPNY
jgi:glycosyltransferase involved in cell wall biosynthesis